MKRGVWFGSMAVVLVAFVPVVGGCAASEPKQASAPDPLSEDSSESSEGYSEPSSKRASGDSSTTATGSGLAAYLEGLRWGMSHAEVDRIFTRTDGIIWKDYDAKLAKANVGPEMTALEAERDRQKAGFSRSYIEFKDTPTGYDATGIKGEYTYKNRESLMWIERAGKKRYFFFINDRLWKIYDEVPFGEGVGANYLEAVNGLNAKLGSKGNIQAANPDKGIAVTTVDWKDGTHHLRALDRSGEGLVAIVVEEQSTLNNIASLRSNKTDDPTAIDPSITAVTSGGPSDPNAAAAEKNDAKPSKKAGGKKK